MRTLKTSEIFHWGKQGYDWLQFAPWLHIEKGDGYDIMYTHCSYECNRPILIYFFEDRVTDCMDDEINPDFESSCWKHMNGRDYSHYCVWCEHGPDPCDKEMACVWMLDGELPKFFKYKKEKPETLKGGDKLEN